MSTVAGSISLQRPKALQVIALGGLVAGTLDISAAFIVAWLRAGITPVRVLHSVASGLLGQASFNGGAKTAALGLVLHFLIATIWTIVFYAASRILTFLIDHAVSMGLLYGVVVYLIMNFVVLPLSAVAKGNTPRLSSRIIGLLVIMFCIGLPISLIVRRFSNR